MVGTLLTLNGLNIRKQLSRHDASNLVEENLIPRRALNIKPKREKREIIGAFKVFHLTD